MPISLPSERTRPPFDPAKLAVLLYGAPKIGKSTFCSRFPRGLFLATEPGLSCLDVYSVQISTWADAVAAVEAIEAAPARFSPIIIDTADRLWDLACSAVAKKAGVDVIADVGYGRGYDRAEELFRALIMRIASLRTGIVLTSHACAVTLQPPGSEKITRWAPSLEPKPLAIAEALVDVIMYAHADFTIDRRTGARVETRLAHAAPSPLWVAGDRTGKLPASMPFSYHAYMAFFEQPAEKAETAKE